MIKNPAQRRYMATENGRAKRAAYVRGRGRHIHFKARYGITLAEYDKILAAQGGACATCRRVVKKFHTDHCHLTGIVRGILCPACNRVLGMIHENSGTLRALAEYLEKQR